MNFPARLLFLLPLALAAGAARCAAVDVGAAFPTLSQTGDPAAASLSLEGRVRIVDFWATWCAPCKASFRAYRRLNAEYAPRGLVIVAVNVDDDAGAYADFMAKYAPPFAVVRDQTHRLVGEVDVPAMPTCYLVDRRGKVRYIHAGYHGAQTDRDLRREVDELLAER